MSPQISLAETSSSTVGSPWINMSIFLAFVAVTLVVVIRASKSTQSAAEAPARSSTTATLGATLASARRMGDERVMASAAQPIAARKQAHS